MNEFDEPVEFGIRLRPRSIIALTIASIAGLAMFLWPLLLHPADGIAHSTDAPFAFIVILPALVAILLAEITEGGIDTKSLAMLGVLAAIGAALRPLGAGTAGIETVSAQTGSSAGPHSG